MPRFEGFTLLTILYTANAMEGLEVRDAAGNSAGDNNAATPDNNLHGPQLWVVVGGMMLGVYLVGLDLTMLSTVCGTYL